MLSIGTALCYTLVLAGVIFFCRFLPFVLFKEKTEAQGKTRAFLDFVEKAAPAATMTVLAFNALSSPVKDAVTAHSPTEIIPLGAAALLTALVHCWKRNPLLSIFGGTALYMLLGKLLAV